MLGRLGRTAAAVLVGASVLVAVTATTDPAEAAPDDTLDSWSTATLPLPNGAIGYDATRDQVLVAVADTVPGLGNHLVEVDPDDGALGRSVWVGSRASELEVAEDGSRAYVALVGSPEVVEVDLASFTITRRFEVGPHDSLGFPHPEDLEIQPGSPGTVVVSRQNLCCSARFDGVAVFDDGVRRPVERNNPIANRLEFGDDPDVVFGYNNETSGFQLSTSTIHPDGITLSSQIQLLSGYSVDITYAAGRLHATNGRVIDPETNSVEGSYGRSGRLVVDEAQDDTFILESDGTLARHSTTTLLAEEERSVPLSGARWLEDAGDALVASDGEVVLLIGPGVSATGFSRPADPPSHLRADLASSIDLDATGLVAAPSADVVLASVSSSDDEHAGELVELDPATGEVVRSVFVGGGPSGVEASDDGTVAYVQHRDANRVTEVDLDTFEIRRTVSFIADGAAAYAGSIAPVPGDADRYAVQLYDPTHSPSHEGVVLVEDGVVLPDKTRDHTGPTTISFAGDPTVLYGINGGSTEYGFYTVDVDEQGLTVASSHRRLSEGFHQVLEEAGGRLYSSNGMVIQPEVPSRIGRFPVAGRMALDEERGRAYVFDDEDVVEVDAAQLSTAVAHPGVLDGDGLLGVVAGDWLVVVTDEDVVATIPVGERAATLPRAPTGTTVSPGDGELQVSWSPPTWDGGAAIAGHRVYVDGSLAAEVGGSTFSATVDGLVNGQAYEVEVSAVNAVGEGPTGSRRTGTPEAPPAPEVPQAPAETTVAAGDGQATVAWTPPASDGGSPVTAYRVHLDGSLEQEVDATTRDLVISGLVNGQAYDVAVSAVNAVGEGPTGPTRTVTPTAPDPGEPTPTFPDVDGDHPFFDEVEWAVGEGITTGYPDGTFRPARSVSRQAMAAFLYRLAGEPASSPPAIATFTDVSPPHPFFREVEWTVEAGLASGYADGTFRPSAEVSRQAMAAFLHRLAGTPPTPVPATPTFPDVTRAHPFFDEVEWAAEAGITNGYADGTFRPSVPVSRAATVAFAKRLVEGVGVGV